MIAQAVANGADGIAVEEIQMQDRRAEFADEEQKTVLALALETLEIAELPEKDLSGKLNLEAAGIAEHSSLIATMDATTLKNRNA